MTVAPNRDASGLPTSPGPGLRAHALAELDSAIAHLAWRGGRVHKGVHLARKALRRTRATLALGATPLGPGGTLVDRELRRLNRGLSRLRDGQALVETLDRLLDAGYDTATTRVLRRARRAAAARRSQVAQEVLASDPTLAARRALLEALRGALLALPWPALTAEQMEVAHARSRRRLHAARRRASESTNDEDWHRWRRRARRVSQQRRALVAIGTDPDQLARGDGSDRNAFDKRATERLGLAQDLTLLIAHCGRESPFSKEDRTVLKAFAELELSRLRHKISTAR